MTRQVELAQDHGHAERPHHAHPDQHQGGGADETAHVDEDEDQGRQESLGDDQRPPQADPVGDGADQERSDGAREQHQKEEPAAVRLGMPFRLHPQRHEGEQCEPGDAPQSDHTAEERHRAAAVVAAHVRGRAALRSEPAEMGNQAGEREGRDHHRNHREHPADEPERVDEQARHERPERIARVAADVEVGHALGELATAGVLRELRALGMECGDAEAAGQHQHEHERVCRRHRREAHTDGGKGHSAGDQPEGLVAVGPETEERLHDRRRERGCEQQHGRECVAQVELVGEVRDQRGDAAGREIDREMAARQRRHRSLVDRGPHTAMLTIAPLRPPHVAPR